MAKIRRGRHVSKVKRTGQLVVLLHTDDLGTANS